MCNQYTFITSSALNYSHYKWSLSNDHLVPKPDWNFLNYDHHWPNTWCLVSLLSCYLEIVSLRPFFTKDMDLASQNRQIKNRWIFIYSFKSILKFPCPFKTEWKHFRASELSTVLTEPKQEFNQGPRGPPRHAFAKIRNLIFVGHHTCYV